MCNTKTEEEGCKLAIHYCGVVKVSGVVMNLLVIIVANNLASSSFDGATIEIAINIYFVIPRIGWVSFNVFKKDGFKGWRREEGCNKIWLCEINSGDRN